MNKYFFMIALVLLFSIAALVERYHTSPQKSKEISITSKYAPNAQYVQLILNERRMGANPTIILVEAPYCRRQLFAGVNIMARVSKDKRFITIQDGVQVLLFDSMSKTVFHSEKSIFLDHLKELYPNSVRPYHLNTVVTLKQKDSSEIDIDFSLITEEMEKGLGDFQTGYFRYSFIRNNREITDLFDRQEIDQLIKVVKEDIIYAFQDGKRIPKLSEF